MGRKRRSLPWIQLSSGLGKVWEGVEGSSPREHLGLISNDVCSVQPMASWPRPCSRRTCPPWPMPPVPAAPTGAPLWRTPWCALEEMEFAQDVRWTCVGTVRSPTPRPPLSAYHPHLYLTTYSTPTHGPVYRLNLPLWHLKGNESVLVTLYSQDLQVGRNLKIHLA